MSFGERRPCPATNGPLHCAGHAGTLPAWQHAGGTGRPRRLLATRWELATRLRTPQRSFETAVVHSPEALALRCAADAAYVASREVLGPSVWQDRWESTRGGNVAASFDRSLSSRRLSMLARKRLRHFRRTADDKGGQPPEELVYPTDRIRRGFVLIAEAPRSGDRSESLGNQPLRWRLREGGNTGARQASLRGPENRCPA